MTQPPAPTAPLRPGAETPAKNCTKSRITGRPCPVHDTPVRPAETDPAPAAHQLPALAVPCPTCGSPAGALCTSHGGTRPRRHDVHQTRTTALKDQKTR
ncbi:MULTISPECIES: hypothetical protein [unclassified Streptomyces]|uniref:zinc finger domain-containing protein n=1 Tax=unclassified Streptomyces TaxID=2593676 RepID=UPI0016615A32|nr:MULTISPECIES: hypothetical protein [unclassified Streptomyces]MBD0707375.1 hypothetical protein [Streptomyces sp. CBMA291]MBD0715173.1 hypothetical protein [Streptomyces sp. CBMA370]